MSGKARRGSDYVTCSCGKRGYTDKKAAKNSARAQHPGHSLHVYRCESGLWHYGHLPTAVLNRGMDRSTLRAAPRRQR